MTARSGSAPVDPSAAQREAQRILSGRQFRSAPTPRPLRKPLNWLGDRLATVGHWFGRLFSHLPLLAWLAIGAAAIALAIAFIATRVAANRSHADARVRARSGTGDTTESAEELERAAAEAERRGRLDEALRLRFRAGLLRLGERGAIRYRPSVTTGEVRRVLGSETFDELAHTFEEVAYGGRDASPPDLDVARREWPRVVTGATKRRGD